MSLKDCFKKAGKALRKSDRESIQELVDDGLSEAESVQQVLSEAQADIDGTLSQVREAGGQVATETVSQPTGSTVFNQALFHGSRHVFDQFDLGKIGSGEGFQAFGYGLYFAESKGTAEFYRTSLTPGPTVVAGDMNFDEYFNKVTGKALSKMGLDPEDIEGIVDTTDELLRHAKNYGRMFFRRAEKELTRDKVMMTAWLEDKIDFEKRLLEDPV